MVQRRIATCFAVALVLAAACGDSGTEVDAGATVQGSFALSQVDGVPLPITLRRIVGVDTTGAPTSSCTEYLTAMGIDVKPSGVVARSESHETRCDGGASLQALYIVESGSVSKTADGWRFDFVSADNVATRYFGRLDGTRLTIVRRESGTPPLVTVDLAQLVFDRP